MITHEMIEAQRLLFSKPILIGEKIAVKLLTVRNRHFGILDGVTVPGRTMVEIEPGFVFGNGIHATTQMVTEAIVKHITEGAMVLDIGCGTGIQSIISLLLGAEHVKAVDIDPAAVAMAQKNAERNGVDGSFTATTGDLAEGVRCRYDLIVANILADPVLRLLGDLPRLCKEDTVVILSGIHINRAADVEAAAARHFDTIEKETRDGWVCYVIQPKP